jgi:hypothetical protein
MKHMWLVAAVLFFLLGLTLWNLPAREVAAMPQPTPEPTPAPTLEPTPTPAPTPEPVPTPPEDQSSAAATPAPLVTTFSMEASQPEWTDTGIQVSAGQIVRITATGSIVWDPHCPAVGPDGAAWTPRARATNPQQFPLPDKPCAALIARIGDDVFYIGANSAIAVPSTGELYLGINERWCSWCWNDNRGAFQTYIRVE